MALGSCVFPGEIRDGGSGRSRKLLCACGKPLAVFDAKGLTLYCRFSKETTTVPYGMAGLPEAMAFVDKRRRKARPPERRPGVPKSGH